MLVVSKDVAIKYMAVLAASALCIFGIIETGDCGIHLIFIWMLTAVAVICSGFDLMHPYFWFSVFFSLYSTAYAIIWRTGLMSGIYSKEQLLYPAIALSIVLLIVGPKKVINDEKAVLKKSMENSTVNYIIIAFALLTVLISLIVYSRDYSSKTQMQKAGDPFYRVGIHLVRFMTFFAVLYASKLLIKKDRKAWGLLALCGFATLVFTLITSERDVVFRFGYTILLLLFCYKVIKPKHLIFVFPLAGAVMAFSTVIKHYFLRGILHTGSGNLFYDFLSSDFTAAGRNLQYLLSRTGTEGVLGWKTFFTELFYPLLIGIKKINPDYWFNNEVHTGSFKGYAFTLVGTGYAIAGLAGVIAIFITVGLIVKFFYNHSADSLYWQSSYIYLSSAVVFSFRQSLQTISNSIIRYIILAVLICWIMDRYRFTVGNKKLDL